MLASSIAANSSCALIMGVRSSSRSSCSRPPPGVRLPRRSRSRSAAASGMPELGPLGSAAAAATAAGGGGCDAPPAGSTSAWPWPLSPGGRGAAEVPAPAPGAGAGPAVAGGGVAARGGCADAGSSTTAGASCSKCCEMSRWHAASSAPPRTNTLHIHVQPELDCRPQVCNYDLQCKPALRCMHGGGGAACGARHAVACVPPPCTTHTLGRT